MVREIVKCDTLEKRLITGLFVMIIAGVALYVYFVNQTVVNVVERRSFEQKMSTLSSDVGDLAQEYIELQAVVTREHARELGFSDIGNVKYVSRDQFALTLQGDL